VIDRSALEAILDPADPTELLALSGELQGRAWSQLAPKASTSEGDRLVDMDEVARVLGVPVAHARELGRRGELPVVNVGRYVRVRAGALAEWMALRERGTLRVRRAK
jgi:excisionase family DNA binding protein